MQLREKKEANIFAHIIKLRVLNSFSLHYVTTRKLKKIKAIGYLYCVS